MKGQVRRFLQSRRGVTLLELSVVAAIITILSTMATMGVTGTAQQARTSALIGDKTQVQGGVSNYISQHKDNDYPTLDGCLPGQTFDTSTRKCLPGTDPGPFDSTDPATYRAIIWRKAFTSTDSSGTTVTKWFVPDFVQQAPRHAFEHWDGTAWPTSTVSDPDGVVSGGLRVPTVGTAAVWVLDKDGNVQSTITSSEY